MVEEEKPQEAITLEKGEVRTEQLEEIKRGQWRTTKELANELGYDVGWISLLCQRGRIKAVKPIGGQWRIPQSEYQRIVNEGLSPQPKQETSRRVQEITVPKEIQDKLGPPPLEPKEAKRERKPFPFSLLGD